MTNPTELNSMRGKSAQNQNKKQTNFVTLVKDLQELLISLGTDVTNIILPKDDVVWLFWKHSEDNITAGINVNVGVTAYVTT